MMNEMVCTVAAACTVGAVRALPERFTSCQPNRGTTPVLAPGLQATCGQPWSAVPWVLTAWLILGGVTTSAAGAGDGAGPAAAVPVITGRTATTKERPAAAPQALGDHGCLAIRSPARWKAVQQLLAGLGWQPPAEDALAKVDFDRQMIVLVYKNGDEADEFAVRRYDGRGKMPALEVVMSYVIYKQRAEVVERCNFLLAAVPRLPRLEVTVSTYHPHNGGPYPTPEKALREWRGEVGTDAGDVADGLRAKIAAKETTVPPGEDIRVKFMLEFADGAQVKSGHFASRSDAAWVWDGKYSHGYRNHAFEVRTPAGKVHFLRPKEILNWDKNVPHPVEVKAGQPYVLPEWYEGRELKSLKALGLDTSRPGTYLITGVYAEAGGRTRWDGAAREMWGGNIASNTIAVEVADPSRPPG